MKQIYIEGGFLKCEQDISFLRMTQESAVAFKNLMRNHLEKNAKKQVVPSYFIFKTFIIKPFAIKTELRKEIEEGYKENVANSYSANGGTISNIRNSTNSMNNEKILKKKRVSLSVLAYYAKEFEALRMENGILLSNFISSLGCSSSWQENSGGKSKASFIKSFDNLFIFKELEKKEFLMFFNYAQSYFDYIWKSSYKKRPSVLTKIYGLYEVKLKNSRYYYICMENLFLGIDPLVESYVYDLKGSETNRYVEKKKKNQTLLDTNFKIDRNGEPLPLKSGDKKFIDVAFENDTRFLNKHQLIDYSLLLIIDNSRDIIRIGIIDYLREYTWDKKMETMAKKISKGGATPTIVDPEEYRNRFKKAMNKYFVEVPSLFH